MSYRVKAGINPELIKKKNDIQKSIELLEEMQRYIKKAFYDFTEIHNRTEMYGGTLSRDFFKKYNDIYNNIENIFQRIKEMKKELKEMENLNP
ncbi:MAG: hypothetical protein RXO36_07455 [Candidatus Nanopusillus acidilobi]